MNRVVTASLLYVFSMVVPVAHAEGPTLVPLEISSITITLDQRLVQVEKLEYTTTGRTLMREFAALVSRAEPGDDHKCRDIGEIRFGMRDGSAVRVGLLPAHKDGIFNLRFYGEGGYTVGQVDRDALLGLLERAGVPARNPEFSG